MKQMRVVLTCDEGFVADSLRDFAAKYEDEFGDFHEVEHGSGFLEFIEVPDPEPSLADIFDKKAKAVRDKREEEQHRLHIQDARPAKPGKHAPCRVRDIVCKDSIQKAAVAHAAHGRLTSADNQLEVYYQVNRYRDCGEY